MENQVPFLFLFPGAAAGAVQSRDLMRVGRTVQRQVWISGKAEYRNSFLLVPTAKAS